MAEKKTETKPKNILERSYNVPLRREWLKVAKHKRSKRAVGALRAFLEKHMKSDNVKLGSHVNEHIWERGIKNPPHHVKVNVTKDEEGAVKAELEGFEFKEAVKSKKTEEKPKGLKGKLQDVMGKGGEETPAEEEAKTENKPKDDKKEVKKETKPKADKKTESKKDSESKSKTKKPVVKKKPVKKPTAKKTTKKAKTSKK